MTLAHYVSLRFMEELQVEVQEMEFLQFSKGMDTMRREDFAEWLLHYTNEEDNEIYWENMRKRIPAGQVRWLFFCSALEGGYRSQGFGVRFGQNIVFVKV